MKHEIEIDGLLDGWKPPRKPLNLACGGGITKMNTCKECKHYRSRK